MRQSPFGELYGWRCRTYPQLRCFAACSGFHYIGPAPRNPQLILNLLVVRGCVATARRHSLLSLPRLLVNYNKLRVPRSGTYIMKPSASCEAAPLWVRAILPPHIVPRRGTDASTMMLRMIVGPASRNQVRVERIVYPTAALLRSLQWVSDEYVSPRDTALLILSVQ